MLSYHSNSFFYVLKVRPILRTIGADVAITGLHELAEDKHVKKLFFLAQPRSKRRHVRTGIHRSTSLVTAAFLVDAELFLFFSRFGLQGKGPFWPRVSFFGLFSRFGPN
jgi:hypothetical protein